MARPALFLDRDGVVVADVAYLHRREECRFMPGLFALTAAFAARGHVVVMATNQSGIGRGLYDEAALARLNDWMGEEIRRHAGRLDAVYYAPTHPTAGTGRFRRASDWRKPGPGMFLAAARDLALDLGGSVAIGNGQHDIDAGRSAGIRDLFLLDPTAPAPVRRGDCVVVPTLLAVAALTAGR